MATPLEFVVADTLPLLPASEKVMVLPLTSGFDLLGSVSVAFTVAEVPVGALVAPRWLGTIAWLIALVIVALNVKLLVDTFAAA